MKQSPPAVDKERIHIKNWEKFQHYSRRRPPWIKLYREILDDIQWHRLDPLAAKTLVTLWLIASEYDGYLPEAETLSFRLRMPQAQLNSVLSKLSHWLKHLDSNMLASRYQHATPETETEREKEVEAERGNPALSVTETQRQIALRKEALNGRPKTNFERSAATTDSSIARVLGMSREVDARVQPGLPPADGGSNGVGIPRNAVRSKRG